MGKFPSAAGGVALPIHVPAAGTLADMSAAGNMLIGGGAGIVNLEIAIGNILRINNGGWITNGSAGAALQTSRLQNQAADEAAAATAGAGAALPATVQGYKIIKDSAGVDRKIPYYAV